MTYPDTPAELARERGVTDRKVRAILRSRYGTLSELSQTRWLLDEEQIAWVRSSIEAR